MGVGPQARGAVLDGSESDEEIMKTKFVITGLALRNPAEQELNSSRSSETEHEVYVSCK